MRVDSRASLAVLVAVLLTGCGAAPPAAPAGPAPPSRPPAPDPVTVCTNQLTYWAGEELRNADDPGFDSQEMGLSGAQAEALLTLVDEARARGAALPADWVPNRARELCTEIEAHPRPTGGSWP